MIQNILVELTLFQERMHKKSKEKFRDYLKEKAKQVNLPYNITPDTFFSKNVVIGDLKNAKYILGAHYDTPPRMPSFLMHNILVFNLFFIITIGLVIYFSVLLRIPVIFVILLITLLLSYPLGFLAIANKYNFNDNTSGVLLLLYLMTKIENPQVAYVFFDNEEKGLIGSLQLLVYMKKHKISRYSKQFIIFDCVGRGNVFGLSNFKNEKISLVLKQTFENFQFKGYNIELKKGSSFEMSDHAVYMMYNHVGIMCYEKKKNKLLLKDIHSHKDKKINLNNIMVLAKTIEEYVR